EDRRSPRVGIDPEHLGCAEVDHQQLMRDRVEAEAEGRRRCSADGHLPQQLATVIENEQLSGCRTRRVEGRDVYIAILAYREAFDLGRALRQHRKGFDVAAIPRGRW